MYIRNELRKLFLKELSLICRSHILADATVYFFVRCNFRCSGLWFYLPSEIHVGLCVVVGTDKNCNFSAVRSPIGLKLGGDLGLVSQISVHVVLSRFDYFLYCKQNKRTNQLKK
jgi:hypothetical protein